MQNPQKKIRNGEPGTPAKIARKSARVRVAGTVERDPFATAGAALRVWEIQRKRIEEKLAAFRHGRADSILLAAMGGGAQ